MRNTLVVAAGLVGVTALMLRPVLSAATHAIPGELRDPLLNTWILAWDADRLRHGFAGLWDTPILYPSFTSASSSRSRSHGECGAPIARGGRE